MQQISDTLFAEDFLFDLEIATPLLPSPYAHKPYVQIANFLSDALCKEIISYCQSENDVTEAGLRSEKDSLNQKIRHTNIHKLSPSHLTLYNEALAKIRPTIEAFFSLSLTQATQPQLLEYTKGSFYKAHADDSSVLMQEGLIKGFKQVAPQRKLTTLLFLSEPTQTTCDSFHYRGGELTFSFLKDAQGKTATLTPKMGTIIVFGSNPYYTHEVHKVQEGHRYSIAQWHDALM